MAVLIGALGLNACSSSTPTVSAATLLQKAKATADSASAVHFVLSSSGVSLSGTNLVNGEGDLVRPSSMQGSFGVAISGFTANVKVVSVGGVFEAELPFTGHYTKTDPASFGLKNPAVLLDPAQGLTRLLTLAQAPTLGRSVRQSGELLETVSYSVPGSAVPVIPDINPSKPVQLTVAINPKSYQLRTVTLTGPFTSATSNSTYVVTLSNYGEHVSITLPAAS
ncbi:MAG: LppX_LprAFG lipoprotein [Acidobacteriota bacterium]|nr:LppX_LprAFG lipoprotein [Acidobacteriota bacterium]